MWFVGSFVVLHRTGPWLLVCILEEWDLHVIFLSFSFCVLSFYLYLFVCYLTRFCAFPRRPSAAAVCLLNISYLPSQLGKVQMHWGWSKAFANVRQLMQAEPENCPAKGKCTWMSAIETGCANCYVLCVLCAICYVICAMCANCYVLCTIC